MDDQYCCVGRGTVTILRKEENKEERESHEINKGDIMQVPAGSIVYVINSDRREKLTVAKLLQPVSTPGRFEVKIIELFLKCYSISEMLLKFLLRDLLTKRNLCYIMIVLCSISLVLGEKIRSPFLAPSAMKS